MTDAADHGAGTLRAALEQSNAQPGLSFRVVFDLQPAGTIRLEAPLPELVGCVSIEGPVDAAGEPAVTIDGTLLGDVGTAIAIASPNPCRCENLIVEGAFLGIALRGRAGHVVHNCILRRNGVGLQVEADECTAERLVVVGNRVAGLAVLGGRGFQLTDSRIGCDRAGTTAQGNLQGIVAYGTRDSRIGPGNVISGNDLYGLVLGGDTRRTRVFGNVIGCDMAGQQALPNGRTGILVYHASDNLIGGAAAGEGNVISGNTRNGINVDSSAPRPENDLPETYMLPAGRTPATGNRIVGNHIGVDAAGRTALPNGLNGVLLFMSQGNHVGGAGDGEGNVISANKRFGILVMGPNPDAPNWRAFARDVRSGDVVRTVPDTVLEPLETMPGNAIAGNIIGADVDRARALGNGNSGIGIFHMPNARIGNDGVLGGNTVSGNALHGITVVGSAATGTCIRNNRIGVGSRPEADLKNGKTSVLYRDVADARDADGLGADGNVLSADPRVVVVHHNPPVPLPLDGKPTIAA